MESVRVDRYLWAIRIFRTRTGATEACRVGHIKVNGSSVKPAHALHPGDRLIIVDRKRVRDLEVVKLIANRMGATLAAACYLDHSPAPTDEARVVTPFKRDPSSGRPTKRDRRQLDRLRRS